MNHKHRILTKSKDRLKECKAERRAYEIWLAWLFPANVITIVMPAVLAAIAGATILGDFFEKDGTKIIAGGAALTSAALTAIHTALKCDSHQAECRRLVQAYYALEAAYSGLEGCQDDSISHNYEKYEERLQHLRESAGAITPEWCKKKAREEIKRGYATDAA